MKGKRFFDVVDAAISNELCIIIDRHDHNATRHLKEVKEFFAEVDQKCGDKPNFFCEPGNEPLQILWSSAIKPYHQAIIDTIRRHDPDNMIICSTPTCSQDVDIAADDPLVVTNIACMLHFYSGTH